MSNIFKLQIFVLVFITASLCTACFETEPIKELKLTPTVALPTIEGKVKVVDYLELDSIFEVVGNRLYMKFLQPNAVNVKVGEVLPIDLEVPEKQVKLKIADAYGFKNVGERTILPLKAQPYPIAIETKELNFNTPKAITKPDIKQMIFKEGKLSFGNKLKLSTMTSSKLVITVENLYENEGNFKTGVFLKFEFDLSRSNAVRKADIILEDYILDLSEKKFIDIKATLNTNAGASALGGEELTVTYSLSDAKYERIIGEMGEFVNEDINFDLPLPNIPLDSTIFKPEAEIKLDQQFHFIETRSTFGFPLNVSYQLAIDGKKVNFESNQLSILKPRGFGVREIDSILIKSSNSDIDNKLDLNSKAARMDLKVQFGAPEIDTTEYVEFDTYLEGDFGIYMPLNLSIKNLETQTYFDFSLSSLNLDEISRGKFLFDLTNELKAQADFSIDFIDITARGDTSVIMSSVSVDDGGNAVKTVGAATSVAGILVPTTSRSYFHFKKEELSKLKLVDKLRLNLKVNTLEQEVVSMDTVSGIDFTINTIVELDK